jgi:hypothetical protein
MALVVDSLEVHGDFELRELGLLFDLNAHCVVVVIDRDAMLNGHDSI